jgi:hypothetical protein
MKGLKLSLFALLILISAAAIASEKESELDAALGISRSPVLIPDIGHPMSPRTLVAPKSYCTDIGLEVCFNSRNRHLSLPGSRNVMPDIPGVKRERVIIQRSGITLQYSF